MVRILFMLSGVCFALAGWLYYDSLPPPPCVIEEPERELTLKPDSELEVTFHVSNPSSSMVKIVGLADC